MLKTMYNKIFLKNLNNKKYKQLLLIFNVNSKV